MGKHAFCIASFQRLAKSLLTTAFPEQAVIKSDFVCTLRVHSFEMIRIRISDPR